MPDEIIHATPPMTVEAPTEPEPQPEPEANDPPPAPEAEAPEADPKAAESVKGADENDTEKQDPPKADEPPPKSNRQKLIDELTAVGETPPEAEPEAEPPAPQDKAPEQPEGKQPEKAPEQDPDLVELTNDTAKAMKPGEARRKINRLITRIKAAEPLAAMSKEIIEACETNKFAPEDYRTWVGIGIGIQQGNPNAIKAFKQIADKMGVTAPAAPAAPALPENLDTWLTAQEKDLEISTTAAAELRKLFLSPKAKTAAPPAPQAPAPQPTAPPAPTSSAAEQAHARASKQLDQIAAEYETKLGAARFAELEPRVLAALKARKGAHPDAWADIMRSAIEAEIAKAPKPKVLNPGVRPGTQTGPSKPVFKTERERVIHKHTA